MSWARKNEGYRLYLERKGKSYLLVDPETMEGVGEVMVNNNPENPQLAGCAVSRGYLYSKCKRASWDEMPKVWQEALSYWIDGKEKEYRGLWRI